MINPSWRCFLSRKRFEVVFESKKRGFIMGIESGRRKTINHGFVQGQGNLSERTDVIRSRTLAQYALSDVITFPALLLIHC